MVMIQQSRAPYEDTDQVLIYTKDGDSCVDSLANGAREVEVFSMAKNF